MFRKKKDLQTSNSVDQQAMPNYERDVDVPLSKEVEDIMWEIERSWNFMTEENFNPVTLALELLDNSNAGQQGRDIDKFMAVLNKLEGAMDFIVNDHYEAFNRSIEIFGKVNENISDSANKVLSLKSNLLKCKDLLLCKRSDLLGMWVKSVQYKEMLRMINTIEDLKKAPEKIEGLFQKRQYLLASKILLSSFKVIDGSTGDFAEIKALSDIRISLSQIKITAHEKIIDDLHRFVYLKSEVFSKIVELQKSYSIEKKDGTDSDLKLMKLLAIHSSKLISKSNAKARVYNVDNFNGRDIKRESFLGVTLQHDSEEGSWFLDPDSQPLEFIDMMLQSLYVLGKLTDGLNIIKQRLPYELFKNTEKVIRESESEAKEHGSYNGKVQEFKLFSSKNSSKIGYSGYILEVFLKNLFQRLLFILETQQYMISCCSRILSSKSNGIKLEYTMEYVWSNIQQEVSNLLSEYLNENSVETVNGDFKTDFLNSKFLHHKAGNPSEKVKICFKFSDSASANSMAASTMNLAADQVTAGVVDQMLASSERSGHTLLVHSNILNLPIILAPTLKFLKKVEDSFVPVASEKSIIIDLLDQKLMKAFLPLLEDSVIQKFHESVNAIDSFRVVKDFEVRTIDNAALMKCCLNLIDLLKDTCFAVYKIPIHQNEFIALIETMLEKFTQKITMKFNAATGPSSTISSVENIDHPTNDIASDELLSRTLVLRSEISQLFKENAYYKCAKGTYTNSLENNDLLSKNAFTFEMNFLKERDIHRSELLFDKRNFEFLANLRTSLNWLVKKLIDIRKKSVNEKSRIDLRPFSEVLSDSRGSHDLESFAESFGRSENEIPEEMKRNALCLILESERLNKFEDITSTLSDVSDKCLFSLRQEIRCHFMYFLKLSMKEGNYGAEELALEPDYHVMSLNHDLVTFQQIFVISLSESENRFVFDGLAVFASKLFIYYSKHIRKITKTGVLKMLKNIQAIQQSLSSISLKHDEKLDKAKKYFELLLIPGKEIVKRITEMGADYTHEEYFNIFRLMYQHELTIPDHPLAKVYEECVNFLNRYFSR